MTSQISLLNELKTIVKNAGAVALEHFGKPNEVKIKPDGSKVSAADYAVNDFLQTRLCALDPSIGWLSEESPLPGNRLDTSRLWIVDPIDGTSSFLNDAPDWTVVAALIENGQPILSAVYNPVHDQLFFAQKGQGALLNNEPIQVSSTVDLNKAKIISSKGHFKRTFENQKERPRYLWRCSMAYRICLVACAEVDATISLTPKSDWDIAASHLILEESGGKIGTPKGKTIRYNKHELRHVGVVAATNGLYDPLIEKTSQARDPKAG